MTIRCADPQRYAAKRQTAAFRLAMARQEAGRRASHYQATRNNAVLRRLETAVITPLRPGERAH